MSTTVQAGTSRVYSSSTAALQDQIPPQPESPQSLGGRNRNQRPLLLMMDAAAPPRGIINPKSRGGGMDGSLVETQTPRPPRTCGNAPGPTRACWSMDEKVAVVLVTVAGALILLLLYRLLQMRHRDRLLTNEEGAVFQRLKLARARNALQYYSFYHAATYTLQDPGGLPHTLPAKNGNIPEAIPMVQTLTEAATPVAVSPLPSTPTSPLPSLPLPPPPLHPPTSTVRMSLPIIHTTPPSPHLSWGASSDADVYSRIGMFRPSRLSSLSGRTHVILFEHSSL